MKTNERAELQGTPLVDFYKASRDERAQRAKLAGLISRLRIVDKHGRDGQPPASAVEMPSQEEIAAAAAELESARVRVALVVDHDDRRSGTTGRCRELGGVPAVESSAPLAAG